MSTDVEAPTLNDGPVRREPQGKARKALIAKRRVFVEQLMCENLSQREMVEALKERHEIVVSLGTVNDDHQFILAEWKLRAHQDYDAHVVKELATLAQAEKAVLPKLWVDPVGAMHAWIEVAQRRAKLLGLDRPTRIEAKHEVTDHRQRSDAELDNLLWEAMRQVVGTQSETEADTPAA